MLERSQMSGSLNESNYSSCVRGEAQVSSVVHHRYGLEGVQALQEHIMRHGPVVSILQLSAGKFAEFSSWRNGTPFDAMGSGITHALAVIGWQNVHGVTAWRVQNSMGESWGVNGHGLVLAPFHENWYSFTLGNMPKFTAEAADIIQATSEPHVDDVGILLSICFGMLVLGSLYVLLC